MSKQLHDRHPETSGAERNSYRGLFVLCAIVALVFVFYWLGIGVGHLFS